MIFHFNSCWVSSCRWAWARRLAGISNLFMPFFIAKREISTHPPRPPAPPPQQADEHEEGATDEEEAMLDELEDMMAGGGPHAEASESDMDADESSDEGEDLGEAGAGGGAGPGGDHSHSGDESDEGGEDEEDEGAEGDPTVHFTHWTPSCGYALAGDAKDEPALIHSTQQHVSVLTVQYQCVLLRKAMGRPTVSYGTQQAIVAWLTSYTDVSCPFRQRSAPLAGRSCRGAGRANQQHSAACRCTNSASLLRCAAAGDEPPHMLADDDVDEVDEEDEQPLDYGEDPEEEEAAAAAMAQAEDGLMEEGEEYDEEEPTEEEVRATPLVLCSEPSGFHCVS